MPSSEPVAGAVRALLSGSPRAAAVARHLAEDELINDGEIVVAVVQLAGATAAAGTAFPHALTEALLASPQLSRRGSALHLARQDHSVLLLAHPGAEARLWPELESLHAAVSAELATIAPEPGLVIGVGGWRPELASAGESYREAQRAAMVGGALPALGPVVAWSGLGAYQVAATLASTGQGDPPLHDGLGSLIGSPEALPLLETLETYLDAAGNAQLTAERLHLHRTSLYYRLQRIEQLARTELKDGMQRLTLHLTLKVARLTGQYVPRHNGNPTSPAASPD
jgi:sugar diacid utilization regulator